MLLINIILFSFCLLFILSNYHSKGGVFLARRWGKRRLKGNEETSVFLLCHKSASHSHRWHPKRQRQCSGEKKAKYRNTQGWWMQGRVTIETPDMGLWAASHHMLSITINLPAARAVIKVPWHRVDLHTPKELHRRSVNQEEKRTPSRASVPSTSGVQPQHGGQTQTCLSGSHQRDPPRWALHISSDLFATVPWY